jgi:hypothetical protein
MVSTLMVVYLGQAGWSLSWREKDGLYPDGGLPGASRLVLILMVVHLEEGGQSGSPRYCRGRRMVSTLMVAYLEQEGWSLSSWWCTWSNEASLDPRGGVPGGRRMVSTLMVAYLEQAGWS